MLSVQTAHFLIANITFILAYAVSVTLAGYFRAWTADTLGDDTARSLGFLTLNPLAHIDFLGLAMLILIRIGWGKFVPINPLNFHGRWAPVKLAAAFLAESFAHFMLAIISYIVLLTLPIPATMTIPSQAMQLFPEISSMILAIGFILGCMMFINTMFAVISLIISACRLGVMFFIERYPEYGHYGEIGALITSLVVLITCARPLYMEVMNVVILVGTFLATLLHVS